MKTIALTFLLLASVVAVAAMLIPLFSSSTNLSFSAVSAESRVVSSQEECLNAMPLEERNSSTPPRIFAGIAIHKTKNGYLLYDLGLDIGTSVSRCTEIDGIGDHVFEADNSIVAIPQAKGEKALVHRIPGKMLQTLAKGECIAFTYVAGSDPTIYAGVLNRKDLRLIYNKPTQFTQSEVTHANSISLDDVCIRPDGSIFLDLKEHVQPPPAVVPKKEPKPEAGSEQSKNESWTDEFEQYLDNNVMVEDFVAKYWAYAESTIPEYSIYWHNTFLSKNFAISHLTKDGEQRVFSITSKRNGKQHELRIPASEYLHLNGSIETGTALFFYTDTYAVCCNDDSISTLTLATLLPQGFTAASYVEKAGSVYLAASQPNSDVLKLIPMPEEFVQGKEQEAE